jgi:poly-gamma-glutamate synthesis protein (capsule biosynthesis protein)
VVIHGTGDVNLDPGYIPAFERRGYGWAFSGLDGLFLEDDLTVVNLECAPSTQGARQAKEFVFGCDVAAYPAMKGFGVDVANLANNHSQDYGTEAMLEGRDRLEEFGIATVGAGEDAATAGQPALFEIGGRRIAVLGFGGIVPHAGWIATDEAPGMRDGDNLETMVAAVESAAEVADYVIVSIHWGVELDTEPRAEDVERAKAMIGAGADAIIGHHPHRLQPIEMIAGRPVAWSLGNFVWPALSTAGSTTAVVRVLISPDGAVEGCLIPAFIESSGHPVLTGQPPCAPR